jgi:heptosyltransferase-2
MSDGQDPSLPYRLLILAPNWLGDVVMHTPLLSWLQAHREVATAALGRPVVLELGVLSAWAGLFQDDPRVDNLVVFERPGRTGAVARLLGFAKQLRKGGYDAIILCPPSLRTGLASWLARIPLRVGYRTDGRKLFLNAALDPVPRGSLHFSREMTQLGRHWLESLAIEAGPKEVDATSSLPGCDALPPVDLGPGSAVWAVAPGTTYGQAKTWPVARLGDFLELAIRRLGVRIVLLGDLAARKFTAGLHERFAADWSEDLGSGAALLDLTGRTDLITAAGILKSCAAFIGNDSGLMHLAGALGRPTVGIFGSSNPDWTAPLGPRTRVVIPEGFACRPCYRKTCNQAEFCLDTVKGETVLAAVQDLTSGMKVQEGGS